MDENQNQTEELKKLIAESQSFSESEKQQLLERLPNLNTEEINEAIDVFKDEQAKWLELDKKDQQDLAYFQEFTQKSKKEMEKMSQEIIHKTEVQETEKESAEAEELLKSL